MTAPVIFLDMDGVIASPRAYYAQGHKPEPDRWIDPVAVGFLNLLCSYTGAVVVVSSSWRHLYTKGEFAAILGRSGFTGYYHDDWRTPGHWEGFRGNEVKDWLAKHPDVVTYVILDDESDFTPEMPLVRTSTADGLQVRHVSRAFKVLCPTERDPLGAALLSNLGEETQRA